MPKLDVEQIMAEVQANQSRMRACAKHQFVITSRLQQRVVCANCAGEMDVIQATRYRDGYIAAGGDRADVWKDIA